MDSMSLIMIVAIAIMFVVMWNSTRKQKQAEQNDWRSNLEKGDPVGTVSGMVGTVEEVDQDREQVVINSNGYLSRWRFAAIVEPPSVPDFVPDSEVDENGNPLPGVEHVTPEAVPFVPLAIDQLKAAGARTVEPPAEVESDAEDKAYDQFRRMRPFTFDGPVSRRS